MTTFKRINGLYIVTHNNTEHIFAHSKQAWAFIFEKRGEVKPL